MDIEKVLKERSGSACELCSGTDGLLVYEVAAAPKGIDPYILVCKTCHIQINDSAALNANHWRSLNNSMWSSIPAVQVMAWRLLNRLRNQGEHWAQDLLDLLYLDDDMLTWAKAGQESQEHTEVKIIHKDSNGTPLLQGDTVVLIKDLEVKGGGFTAKRGTTVKGISLVDGNASQIEGKVNGQQIVLLTQFVKKSS
jgi:protein PhnA